MTSDSKSTDNNSYVWWSKLFERKLWDLNTLSSIGTVCDLLIDNTGNLLGLGYRSEYWFEAGRFVALSAVKAITPERVNIFGEYRVNTFNPRPPQTYSVLLLGLLGAYVFNPDGHTLGALTDVCSALNTGNPIAVKTNFSGRSFQFAIESIERVGRQGLTVTLDEKTTTDLAEILSYGDEPQDVGLILTPDTTSEEIGIISERFAQKKRAYLLGKVCPRSKFDFNGTLLVAAGEVLTQESLERLERAGKLEEVFFDLTISGRYHQPTDFSAEGG